MTPVGMLLLPPPRLLLIEASGPIEAILHLSLLGRVYLTTRRLVFFIAARNELVDDYFDSKLGTDVSFKVSRRLFMTTLGGIGSQLPTGAGC